MADITSTSKTLKIENGFVDGDTRTISLKNPSNDISESDIEALNSWMQVNQPIIGDKWGGTFGKIRAATVVTTTTKALDI